MFRKFEHFVDREGGYDTMSDTETTYNNHVNSAKYGEMWYCIV